jgi:hypothetical protein
MKGFDPSVVNGALESYRQAMKGFDPSVVNGALESYRQGAESEEPGAPGGPSDSDDDTPSTGEADSDSKPI